MGSGIRGTVRGQSVVVCHNEKLEWIGLWEKGSGTKNAKHPSGRSGFWYLTPFPGQFWSFTSSKRKRVNHLR